MARIAPIYTKDDTTGIVSGKFKQVKFVIQNTVGSVSVGETLKQEIPRLPAAVAEVTAVQEILPSQFAGGREWNAKITTQEDIDADISTKIRELQDNYKRIRQLTYTSGKGTVNLYAEFDAIVLLATNYLTGTTFQVGDATLGTTVFKIKPTFSAAFTNVALGQAVSFDPIGSVPVTRDTTSLRSQLEASIYPNGPTRDDGTFVTLVTATLKNGAFSNQTDSNGNKYKVNTNTGSSFNLSGTGIQGTVLQVEESFVEEDLPFEDIVIETFLENMKAPQF